ncbi:MAG TPA: DNA mismatch repair endonuclease MutL [Lachnospiraceae bacterium]|nr:DNA mismatch repair endonuclease MutL [Lachnospiraceae bacterium]
MSIQVLDKDTVNKIAAGEVVERPMAVVKELIENAIDAGASSITVEIKDGGKSLIRVTDNGSGITEDDIKLAFAPHATSKIRQLQDLLSVSTLGFRGEALASIAAVSQLEMLTKTRNAFNGSIYAIEGGSEKRYGPAGCPDGTTFIVRNLFYNTPARLKFLKTPQTEAGYINSLAERMALSHPEISFRFISQDQTKLCTSGNGNIKDIIYNIYGKDITSNLLPFNVIKGSCKINGFIGKPVISRGNRSYINYFINGRFIKSNIICHAVEEAYAPYMMQHKYPFTVLYFNIAPQLIDVNVHPQKMEIRFTNEKELYKDTYTAVSETLKHKELIPDVTLEKDSTDKNKPEKDKIQKNKIVHITEQTNINNTTGSPDHIIPYENTIADSHSAAQVPKFRETAAYKAHNIQQETLFETIMPKQAEKDIKIIGQVFSTYWILQHGDNIFLVDQHAAHEKVLYEKLMKQVINSQPLTQMLAPPLVLSLSMLEQQALEENTGVFAKLGYRIENFGGREYIVTGVPAHLPDVAKQELILEVIDGLVDNKANITPETLLERIATMSCKAAVKGGSSLPEIQMHELLKELMSLENPYNCPHGRPTMIKITKRELEKRFKRIV